MKALQTALESRYLDKGQQMLHIYIITLNVNGPVTLVQTSCMHVIYALPTYMMDFVRHQVSRCTGAECLSSPAPPERESQPVLAG